MIFSASFNNKTNGQNNSADYTWNKDFSYVPSNTSCDDSLARLTMNSSIKTSAMASANTSTNASFNAVDISLNVSSGKCARDDADMFVLSTDANKKKHFCTCFATRFLHSYIHLPKFCFWNLFRRAYCLQIASVFPTL